MKKNRWLLAGVVAGVSALAVTSCAYDPYYSGGSSYYSGGSYGQGYGYGGSGFSTSFFVSTGNPRWGYDPYAGAYYDYTRRCYYDPHLYGYYPVGYRPRYVYGAPHPHGWTRGRNYIAPPSRIRSYNLTNYQNRAERYRGLGRDWSRNVSTAPSGRDQRPDFGRGQGANPGGGRTNQSPFFGGGNQSPTQQRGWDRSGGRQFNQPVPNTPGRGGSFRGNNDGNSRGGNPTFGRGNSPVLTPPVMQPRQPRPDGFSGRGGQGGSSWRDSNNPGARQQPQFSPPRQERMRPQPQQSAPQGDGNGRGFRGGGGGGGGFEGRGRSRGPIGLGQG